MGWEILARVCFFKRDERVFKTYVSYEDGTREIDVSDMDFDRVEIRCINTKSVSNLSNISDTDTDSEASSNKTKTGNSTDPEDNSD